MPLSSVSPAVAVILAAATATGAAVAPAVPLPLASAAAGSCLAAALLTKRPVVLAIGLAVLAGALADRAWSGLAAEVPGEISGRVVLVSDPEPITRGARAEIRHEGRRYEAFARGGQAGVLRGLLVGETLELSGTVEARRDQDRWRASRHVAGIVEVTAASDPVRAGGVAGLANSVHRSLQRASSGMEWSRRGVLAGVSVGDTRELPPEEADDLRVAGLTHLTAVSGQHVALVMTIARPLLVRLPRRARTVLTLAVLGWFALLTRAQPSVLRAVVMAGVAEVCRARGDTPGAARALSVAVVVLVLVDPLIVWSLAFQLSVLATAGIIAGAGRLAARLPGPRMLAEPAAVTLCAQGAVAPLVTHRFESMSVVSIPANLAVAPVVGWLLGWGLTVGVAAGLFGAGIASVLMWPAELLAGWILAVARHAAAAPLGSVRTGHAIALWVLLAILALAYRRPLARRAVAVGVAAVLAVAAVPAPQPGEGHWELGTGVVLVAGEDRRVLVVDGRAQRRVVLEELASVGVTDLDVLVLVTASAGAQGAARAAAHRADIGEVLVPPGADVPGASELVSPVEMAVGRYTVSLRPDGERLEVGIGDLSASR